MGKTANPSALEAEDTGSDTRIPDHPSKVKIESRRREDPEILVRYQVDGPPKRERQ